MTNPMDTLISAQFQGKFHLTLRLMCVLAMADEAKHLQGIPAAKTVGDLSELLVQAFQDGARQTFGFSFEFAGKADENGEVLASALRLHIGAREGNPIAFMVVQNADGMSLSAGTYAISNVDGINSGMSRETPAEFAALPHTMKHLLHDALTAFPAPAIGDATLVRDALIGLLDYKPLETFLLEREVAYHMLTALDILDLVRGVDPEDDDSFAFRWSEYQVLSQEPPRASFLTEALKALDGELEVELICDDTQNIITEVILGYPMPDGRIVEVGIDMISVTVDLDFAYFQLGDEGVFEARDAGYYFRDTSAELREVCIRVLDGLALFTKGSAEQERRRARRVLAFTVGAPAVS